MNTIDRFSFTIKDMHNIIGPTCSKENSSGMPRYYNITTCVE